MRLTGRACNPVKGKKASAKSSYPALALSDGEVLIREISEKELLSEHRFEKFKQASTFGALSNDTIAWLLHEGCIHTLNEAENLFEHGDRGTRDKLFGVLRPASAGADRLRFADAQSRARDGAYDTQSR